jgi:hypothetical protein
MAMRQEDSASFLPSVIFLSRIGEHSSASRRARKCFRMTDYPSSFPPNAVARFSRQARLA